MRQFIRSLASLVLAGWLGACAAPQAPGNPFVRRVPSISVVHATVSSWEVDLDFPRGPITAPAVVAYQIRREYVLGGAVSPYFTVIASMNTSSRDTSDRQFVRQHVAWRAGNEVENVVNNWPGVDGLCPGGSVFSHQLLSRDGGLVPVRIRYGCWNRTAGLPIASVWSVEAGHLLLAFNYSPDFGPSRVRNLRVLTELRAGRPRSVLETDSVDDLIREVLRRAL